MEVIALGKANYRKIAPFSLIRDEAAKFDESGAPIDEVAKWPMIEGRENQERDHDHRIAIALIRGRNEIEKGGVNIAVTREEQDEARKYFLALWAHQRSSSIEFLLHGPAGFSADLIG